MATTTAGDAARCYPTARAAAVAQCGRRAGLGAAARPAGRAAEGSSAGAEHHQRKQGLGVCGYPCVAPDSLCRRPNGEAAVNKSGTLFLASRHRTGKICVVLLRRK